MTRSDLALLQDTLLVQSEVLVAKIDAVFIEVFLLQHAVQI